MFDPWYLGRLDALGVGKGTVRLAATRSAFSLSLCRFTFAAVPAVVKVANMEYHDDFRRGDSLLSRPLVEVDLNRPKSEDVSDDFALMGDSGIFRTSGEFTEDSIGEVGLAIVPGDGRGRVRTYDGLHLSAFRW